ncbi:MAG: alpha/beta hydrolase [Lewinellaceae bacterium]|nr:alpha/beta hydrolase [Lewinellaceae bacterium]
MESEPQIEPSRRFFPGQWRLSRLLRWLFLLLILGGILVNYHEDIPAEKLQGKYGYPDSRFVAVEGMQVHCRVVGKGEALVLLHDADNSMHTWDAWVDSLSRSYKVIVLDLPGFGLTGPHPQGSYSTFMYVSFLEEFVGALRLRQFHLVGNGLGAQIAWFYAVEHPERLRKLVLLNAPGFEKSEFSLVQFMASAPVLNRVFRRITPRSAFRIMLEDRYADDARVNDAMIDQHFQLFLRPGSRKAYTNISQVRNNRPPADIIEKIAAPTLILWGAEDTRISPEFAYEFHRRIRKSQLKIYQNSGHWPQEEIPGPTTTDVRSFLEGRF